MQFTKFLAGHTLTHLVEVLKSIFACFLSLADSLKSMDVTRAGKWRKYLEIKRNFYLSYVSNITDL